jgi:hypothetical protein
VSSPANAPGDGPLDGALQFERAEILPSPGAPDDADTRCAGCQQPIVDRYYHGSATAHFGALVNLFNLVPVWSLDGARGIHSLTRRQRGLLLGLAALLWVLTWNPMLFLIAAVMAWRYFTRDWQTGPDHQGLVIQRRSAGRPRPGGRACAAGLKRSLY